LNSDKSLNEARRFRDEVHPKAFVLLPSRMHSVAAVATMLAIGLQESEFLVRVQREAGPAHGYHQFERGGGIGGVLSHPASKGLARNACEALGVKPATRPVWEYIATPEGDVLDAVFARLLLWTSPRPLPGPDDEVFAWDMYAEELWRPGRPHREKWHANFVDGWRLAEELVG
jgi:hypothetical protein